MVNEEWFYNSSDKRRTRKTLSAVLLILVLVNIGILTFFVLDFHLTVDVLQSDVDTLQKQFDSNNHEIIRLQEQIDYLHEHMKLLNVGNASKSLTLVQLYNSTWRSVVLITVRAPMGGGQGSGFIYDEEGRIITNYHVAGEAADIKVTFFYGTIVSATLLGADKYSDLAIIDVNAPDYLLKPLTLGSSSELLVGEQVVAIGNPFGLADSMTWGIVSAVGRQMAAPGGYTIIDVIQTDAAINPGNSGGPLLNMRGEVVGMNTAILSETRQFSGIGFAIPSNTIKREAPSLIETGSYLHPYLGIRGMDVTPAIIELMGLEKGTRGALVVDIVKGGPAEKAGLQGGTTSVMIEDSTVLIGGDIIIGVDGKKVRNFYDLVFYLERYKKPGNTIELRIIRNRQIMALLLTLGIRP